MMNKILFMGLMLKTKVANKFREENGEVNVIAIIVLIGIAISLALIFKEKITDLIRSLLDAIGLKAKDAIN